MKAYSKNPKKVKRWQAGKSFKTKSLKKSIRQEIKKIIKNQ